MADFRAVNAVSQAVIHLLRNAYRPEELNHELEFEVVTTRGLGSRRANGVTLLPYRIFTNGQHRTPSGRVGADGRRRKGLLPLEVHFLLTAWGEDSSLQLSVAGWMMRTLEDSPILPAGLLNAVESDVFRPEESVQIVHGDLSTEDLLRIWDVTEAENYELSVPYEARVVMIESRQDVIVGTEIQERNLRYGVVDGEDKDQDVRSAV